MLAKTGRTTGRAWRIAVIGLGRQGLKHWQAVKSLGKGNFELVAGCDVEPNAAVASELFFTDPAEMLAKTKPDAVLLTTPNYLHWPLAKLALEHGCHVVKEKPLACSVKEAQVLLRLAESKHRSVITLQQRWYSPLFTQLQKWLPDIGPVEHFSYRFTVNDTQPSWYWDADQGGGCWLNMGWHALAVIRQVLGPMTQLELELYHGQRRTWSYQTNDSATAHVMVKGHVHGTVYVSCVHPKSEVLEITGHNGVIKLGRAEVSLSTTQGTTIFSSPITEAEIYRRQWLQVSQWLASGEYPVATDYVLLKWLLEPSRVLEQTVAVPIIHQGGVYAPAL
jgi:predicted dehydrogenase